VWWRRWTHMTRRQKNRHDRPQCLLSHQLLYITRTRPATLAPHISRQHPLPPPNNRSAFPLLGGKAAEGAYSQSLPSAFPLLSNPPAFRRGLRRSETSTRGSNLSHSNMHPAAITARRARSPPPPPAAAAAAVLTGGRQLSAPLTAIILRRCLSKCVSVCASVCVCVCVRVCVCAYACVFMQRTTRAAKL
jgi:hypothetical protein